MITSHRFESKLGYITLYHEDEFLVGLDYEGSAESGERIRTQLRQYIDIDSACEKATEHALAAQAWLERYFDGADEKFTLPIRHYGSPFQISVWQELLNTSRGQTLSYSELAQRLSCLSARALGTAVGRNTIPIIVPCHRVVRKDGVIGKFSAGNGTESKLALLRLEGAL